MRAFVLTNVSANVPTYVRTEVSADVRANVLTNVSANVPTYVRTEVSADVRADVLTKVRTDVFTKVPTNVSANVRANTRADMRTKVRANVLTNVSANVPTNTRANMRANVGANTRAIMFVACLWLVAADDSVVRIALPAAINAAVVLDSSVPISDVAVAAMMIFGRKAVYADGRMLHLTRESAVSSIRNEEPRTLSASGRNVCFAQQLGEFETEIFGAVVASVAMTEYTATTSRRVLIPINGPSRIPHPENTTCYELRWIALNAARMNRGERAVAALFGIK